MMLTSTASRKTIKNTGNRIRPMTMLVGATKRHLPGTAKTLGISMIGSEMAGLEEWQCLRDSTQQRPDLRGA